MHLEANPVELRIDAEKAKKWLGNGAQPTETTVSLLRKLELLPAAPAGGAKKKA